MKKSVGLVCSVLALATAVLPAISRAEALPEFRPALIANTKRSLINSIDVKSLMKRGQSNATVMFSCGVDTLGFAGNGVFYRGTPDSDKLGKEVVRRCDSAEFIPAVYHHTHVAVWISGTATFIIKDGQPHLRIYLNQEQEDLMKGRDFIAPQFVITPGFSKFRGFYWPSKASGHEGLGAATLTVDKTGRVVSSEISYEFPPGMGFGEEVAGRVTEAVFIPGFRDGQPVACKFTWTLIYSGASPQMSTG